MASHSAAADGSVGPAATVTSRSVRAGRGSGWLTPWPRAWHSAGWALLVLRAFLGITFCVAGIQKLANPGFFRASQPGSIQSQLIAAQRTSPLHPLLGHLIQVAAPLGVLIALGELAVGIGTLLGLWTRLAALGGLVISLSLFLTVSFATNPYYTGSDIVFLFAWTPLLIAGDGGVWSLEARLSAAARRESGLAPDPVVAIAFSRVQSACGVYQDGICGARGGAQCAPGPCPYLRGELRSAGGELSSASGLAARRSEAAAGRRALVLQGTAALAAGVVGAAVGGLSAVAGRVAGGSGGGADQATATLTGPGGRGGAAGRSQAPSGTSSSQAPATSSPSTTAGGPAPSGRQIGAASQVPVGGAARFTDPSSGDPALVVQEQRGQFSAFDAICPHAGCVVEYAAANQLFVCPCHGSEFDGRTGHVMVGPAQRGLTPIAVTETAGQLYVKS